MRICRLGSVGNIGATQALADPSHGQPASVTALPPPLATLSLQYEPG
jgi:hypothetical protein